MSDIRFSCIDCGQHLEAPPDMVGEQITCPSCNHPLQVPRVATIRGKPVKPVSGPWLGRILAGIVGGGALAVLSGGIVATAFFRPLENYADPTMLFISITFFLVVMLIAVVVAIYSPPAVKAWRHLLIMNGVLAFMLPSAVVAMLIRTQGLSMARAEQSIIIEVGSLGLNGVVMAVVVGFFCSFYGIVCLTIGLLLGKGPARPK